MALRSEEPKKLPALDPIQRRLLPIADLFMGLMLSRPGGLSLRSTRVTSATIGLALGVAVLVGIPGLVVSVRAILQAQPLLVGVGLLAAATGFGAACLAAFGLRQRRLD